VNRRLGRRAAAIAGLLVAAAAGAAIPGQRFEARGRTIAPARRPAPRRRAGARRPHRRDLVRGAAARRLTIPILMYHVIGRRPAGAPYPQLWVTPRAFRAQLRGLARRGYEATTLTRAMAAWRHGGAVPRHPVVLSFDDGYRSDATVVAPLLRRRGWPGVLDLAIRNTGPGGLSLASLRHLVRSGWEIDSHSVHHPDLTTLAPRPLRAELVGSQRWIRRRLGVRARFFCYPAGRFDPAVVSAVRAAGYAGATSERRGRADRRSNPDALPRIRVTQRWRARDLLAGAS
jgi:peptidoglycan/xylan/chitin deacetylase (PgdA/CDA1 family)